MKNILSGVSCDDDDDDTGTKNETGKVLIAAQCDNTGVQNSDLEVRVGMEASDCQKTKRL
jgi:hypothetical protein